MLQNGTIWKDTAGHDIQAHGGMILRHGERWYWYGENKGAPNCPGARRVDVIGISCYSSPDLMHWKDEGLVLKANRTDPAHPLYYKKVCERPKVLYCEKTGRFVLWCHLDDAAYRDACVGIAVSDSPTGPFALKEVKRPNGVESRDMTLFRDTDGRAYLIHSSDGNRTLRIARLTETYTDIDGAALAVLPDQLREAPALCRQGDRYYMITSGCTGWKPNSALYAVSDRIDGHWRLIDNPCEGEGRRQTFGGQSTWLFTHAGQTYLLLDHWMPNDLQHSGYSILPVFFEADGTMRIPWTPCFSL